LRGCSSGADGLSATFSLSLVGIDEGDGPSSPSFLIVICVKFVPSAPPISRYDTRGHSLYRDGSFTLSGSRARSLHFQMDSG